MKEKEFIIITESFTESWLRDASTLALFVSLIGLGWIIDSDAMQWAGVIVAFIVILARSNNSVKRFQSREEAIDYLQKGE